MFDCRRFGFKFWKIENNYKVIFFFLDVKMEEPVPMKPPRGVKIKEQGQNKEPVVSKNKILKFYYEVINLLFHFRVGF